MPTAKIDPKEISLVEGIFHLRHGVKVMDSGPVIKIKGRSDLEIPKDFIRNKLHPRYIDYMTRSGKLIELWREVIVYNQYIEFEDLPNT